MRRVKIKKMKASLSIPVSIVVCPKCRKEFVLYAIHSGEFVREMWNKGSTRYCPYCGEGLGKSK